MIIELHYTEALVRLAVKRFCWFQVGPLYVVAVLMVLFGLASAAARGDTSWLTGVLATVLLLGLTLPVALYRVQLTASLLRYRALANRPATLLVDVTSFAIQSAAGSNTLPWRAITAIIRYNDFWLLILEGGGFMTLPLEGTAVAAQDYVIDRVKAYGGKVN
jgi:hypothetical protein